MKNNFPFLTKRCSAMLLLLGMLGSFPNYGVTAFATSPSVPGVTQSRNITLKGTIIDETGETVPGAAIQVVGTPRGVTTDMDGTFSIDVPKGAKLEITYLGMEPQTITVGDKNNLRIILKQKVDELDEVTVVAFAKQKKESVLASVSTIKPAELKAPTSNLTTALAGRVAGLISYQRSGEPGADNADFFVRGVTTFGYAKSPLILVDDVEMESEDLARLQVDDIASFSIMKDATATALYGARGANGVILVTTKKGATGKATVNLDAKWGTNRRGVSNYDVMTSPQEYVENYYTAMLNGYAGGDPNRVLSNGMTGNQYINSLLFSKDGLGYPVYTVPNGEGYIGVDGKLNPNAKLGRVYGDYYITPDDWEKELLDNGNLRQEYNVNISGSTEKMNYYMSAGYLDDSGLIPGSSFSRLSFRLKADYQVKEWLKVGANVAYSNIVSRYPDEQTTSGSSTNLFYITNNIAPIYPLYIRNADGSIKKDARGFTMYDYGNGMYTDGTTALNRPFLSQSNPASALQLDKNEYNMDILSGRAFVEVSIIEGLKATANWGMDLDNTRYTELINPYYGQYAGNTGGVVGVSHSRVFSINQQYLLTYKKNFGDHNIDLLAGFESYDYKNQALSGSKQKVYNPNIVELNNAINTPSANSSTANYATAGFLFRAQYDYLEKYFASASFRRDASSRFHPDNRWGNFWSVGLGWLMNKESFLQNTSWIDMLKFKISYGAQGNDNIGNYYAYLDQYTVSNSNNDFALALSYKGNKDITWETSHSFNTGFDFEFFKGRLSGTVEYFSRKTTDMLYNKPMNASAGYASIPMNVGSMTNKGVELDLNGLLIETNDLTWRMNFNLTHFKNTINELDPSLNGEMISGSYIYREGESRYQFYLRKYAGVDENGVAQYYKDITDAEGNVTGQEKTTDAPNATRYATGDILPKVYGGFGTSLNAYGFDFSISFAYQLGGRMYDNGYASLMNSGTDPGQNWHKDILKAWTADNKGSNIPRLSATDQYANYLSDRFLTKSDYLSINSITLGYTLPKSWVRSLNISSLRVYMSADNVALFSKRKGFDPRQSYTTASADVYSPIRAISGGLSLSF